MCGLRARYHKAQSNQTSKVSPCLRLAISGLAVAPLSSLCCQCKMGPFGALPLSCSGDLEVPMSADIGSLKAHRVPTDAASNG